MVANDSVNICEPNEHNNGLKERRNYRMRHHCEKQLDNNARNSNNSTSTTKIINRCRPIVISIFMLTIISCFSKIHSKIYFGDVSSLLNMESNTNVNDNNLHRQLTFDLRYTMDSLCNGCRFEYSGPDNTAVTCQYEIEKILKERKELTVLDAATIVANELINTGYCQRCNPISCNNDDKVYYRPDDVLSNQFIDFAKTHYLQSIDTQHRIPPTVFASKHGLTQYLSSSGNVYPEKEYFFEFNPSIVQLPINQIPKQLLKSTTPNFDPNNDKYYLASYRVSTAHNCLASRDDLLQMIGGDWDNRQWNNDYLGIAILDIHLNILIETVVDYKRVSSRYQDGRLFNLNGQVYLGSYQRLHPLWIIPPINSEDQGILEVPHYMTSQFQINQKWIQEDDESKRLKVYYRKSGICSNDIEIQKFGKNLNYFVDDHNRTILETSAMGPKEVIDITQNCEPTSKTVNFIQPNQLPVPSFGTTDEIELASHHEVSMPFSMERGSTCCISIDDPRDNNNKTLLLGMSHSKSKPRKKSSDNAFAVNDKQYFSTFYAMEPYEPYNIVARTGHFCLEYPVYNNDTTKSNVKNNEIENPYPRLFLNPLKIGNEIYNNCPSIHFVMGMTEALHDSNKIVISYGIDDCLSRFIVVDKQHIISMLFQPNSILKSKDNNSNQIRRRRKN